MLELYFSSRLPGQYAFTEMDKRQRKKSEKRAMNEVRTAMDVKGRHTWIF